MRLLTGLDAESSENYRTIGRGERAKADAEQPGFERVGTILERLRAAATRPSLAVARRCAADLGSAAKNVMRHHDGAVAAERVKHYARGAFTLAAEYLEAGGTVEDAEADEKWRAI